MSAWWVVLVVGYALLFLGSCLDDPCPKPRDDGADCRKARGPDAGPDGAP